MIKFSQYLVESKTPRVLYRGVTGKYDSKFAASQKIVWLSTSEDHAKMYADSGDLVSYRVAGRLDPLDLGFRAAEISVPFSEVSDRFRARIMDRFQSKAISKNDAMSILDTLDDLQISGHKQVWKWVHDPKFLPLIKKAGFNAVKQREGLQSLRGDVDTYGILDYSTVKRIKD